MMEQKVVFLDIDGTLTQPGCNEVPASAVWAIAQARAQGHYVYLCTGRNFGMLSPLLKYDFDGIISSAGGYIQCGDEVIYDCPMTEPQRQAAMDVLEKNGIFRTVECKEHSYVDECLRDYLYSQAAQKDNIEILQRRERLEQSLGILPMKEYQGEQVYKIVVMSKSMEALVRAHEALEKDFDLCVQEKDVSGLFYGEVVNKAFDKGRAIARVCSYLHLPIERSMAFGDSLNDLEMMQTAGLSICMDNGSEKLKKIADDICPSVSEHGIRAAFYKYRLITA